MGSRSLPYECPVHPDVTIDWGDFGPCQGHCEEVHPDLLDQCPDSPGCWKCDQEADLPPLRVTYLDLGHCPVCGHALTRENTDG